ncbi:hypothetical protein [Nonomuraea sp. NPDC005650]|uniref:hypothetical protein n=1 Tax=Nonomuraea sp. NPDC005650 TaxID=3157045 RepID=UPI0033A8B8E5
MTLMAATPDLAAASPVRNTLKTAAQHVEGPLPADTVAMLPVAAERREAMFLHGVRVRAADHSP